MNLTLPLYQPGALYARPPSGSRNQHLLDANEGGTAVSRIISRCKTSSEEESRLVGMGLVVVLRSEKEGLKAGDYMVGFTTWEAYTVQPYVDGTSTNPR